MAARIEVNLDKGNVDPELRKTASEVRDVGKAASEATRATKQLGEAADQAGKVSGPSVTALAAKFVGAAAALNVLTGVAREAGEAIASMGDAPSIDELSKRVESANRSFAELVATASSLDSENIGSAVVEVFRQIPQLIDDAEVLARESLFRLKAAVVGVDDEAVKSHTSAIQRLREAAEKRGTDLQAMQQQLETLKAQQRAEELLGKERERAAAEDRKNRVEALESIDAVNSAIDGQIKRIRESQRAGTLTDENAADIDRMLSALHSRKVQLLRAEDAEFKRLVKERERLEREAEDSLHERRKEHLAEIGRLWNGVMRQVQGAFDAFNNLADKSREAQQAQIDALAKQLGGSDQLKRLLSGDGISQRDVAKAVGEARAAAADPQDAEAARRRGFRDVVRGRATPEELESARRRVLDDRITAAAGSGQIGQDTAAALRQILEQQRTEAANMQSALQALTNAAAALSGQVAPGKGHQPEGRQIVPEQQAVAAAASNLGSESLKAFQRGASETMGLVQQLVGLAGSFADVSTKQDRAIRQIQEQINRIAQRGFGGARNLDQRRTLGVQ